MEKPEYKTIQNKGFLLTRQSYDRQGKAEIIFWLSTTEGPVRLCISGDKPVFF